jgi:hypothetical protein
MATIYRLRAEWGGNGVVGPGLSTFYFSTTSSGAADAVETFFTSLNPVLFPAGLTINVPSSGDAISDATGELTGTWSEPGTGGIITGTGTGDYALGVGMRVVWQTSNVFRGRRVRGATFICPIMGAIFAANGTLDDATVASASAAANTMVTGGVEFLVWSRPGAGYSGVSNIIDTGFVPDKVSWLRSRRT